MFLSNLFYQYGFLPRSDYLALYAQGMPLLTEDLTKMALQDCTASSESIVQLAERLERIVDSYEAGQIDHSGFTSQVAETVGGIRSLNKKIRKDQYLRYVDQRKSHKVAPVSRARSLAEVRGLVAELRRTASKMDEGLTSYYGGDGVQTISVSSLERPSFQTMTKQLDRIAKTIGKSVKSL
jgi:hypothetical protein